MISEYLIHLAVLFCIYAILTHGFNFVFGLGGLFNLAHVAFFAIGAYTSAICASDLEFSFIACLIYSALFSGLLALLIGEVSLALNKDYFAMGTLSFSAIVSALLINWKSLTRGVLGIPGIPRNKFFNIDLSDSLNFFYITFSIFIFSSVFFYFVYKSRFARSLKALALDESAALSLGRNPRAIRNLAFFISACFAGLAGSLFAFYITYIDPSSFSLAEMVLIFTICIVAKPGSYWGVFPSVLLVVILIPEGLRFLDLPSSVLGPLRQLLNALLLFIIVYFSRYSLFPKQREI